jgi:hypothetical protein
MQPLSSMTPEQRELYAQQFRARAGIGVPAAAAGAGMAALGVPAAAAGGGTALALMPNTMGNQEQDPRYRQQIQDQARTGFEDQGFQQPTQPGGQGAGGLAQLLQSLMGR